MDNTKVDEEAIFDKALQEQIEEAIKTSIAENRDIMRVDLAVAVHDMLGGKIHKWQDNIHEMKEHLKGVLSLITKPEIFAEFKKVCPYYHEDGGESLVRLLDFFYAINNSYTIAQIDLASISESSFSVKDLEGIQAQYLQQ